MMDADWLSRALAPEVVIPTLITVIFGVVAIWYARRGPVIKARQRDLAISVRRKEVFLPPIVRVDEFNLQFRGKPVTHVAEYRFVVANTGYEPIVKSDYDEPIALKFERSGGIFDYKATICSPKNLKVDLSFDNADNSIVLAPVLLNPGDFVCIDFVATNRPNLNCTGRIRGIISFETLRGGVYDSRSTTDPLVFVLSGLLIATMPLWGQIFVRSDIKSSFEPQLDWGMLVFVVFGMIIVYGGIWMYRRLDFLRQARYLGGGTEELFLFGENENIK